MAGFLNSSAWMFHFLLLNFILVSQSVPYDPCTMWRECHRSVQRLWDPVKDCSENCSAAQISVDRKCLCLNLSVSPEDDPLPAFFIRGLEALNPNLLDCQKHVTRIINKLNYTVQHCKIDSISSLQSEKPSFRSAIITSPKVFMKKLKDLVEELTVKSS